MKALVVEDLVVGYGDFVAVREARFGVEAGEVFGLLGPNGAGKTSIMRVLTTLLKPVSGRAWILGHDVTTEAATARRLIGYVPQALSADGSLTGRENATLFARLHGVPRADRDRRIRQMLELMDIADAADRVVRSYSGGMVRRLEIACALLHRPRLLLLDEPTIGLDPVARRAVWRHLAEMRAETGLTTLVTTHLMEEAEEQCERVAVMSGGHIRAEGSPEELRAALGAAGGTLEDVFVSLTSDAEREEVISVTSAAAAAPPDALVEAVPALSFREAAQSYVGTVIAMAQAELHRSRRERTALVARAAQPLLWLLVFGSAVSRVRGLGVEGVPYKSFLVPGVLSQSVLFVAIFSGMAIIWERDLGITQRVLVAPASRSAVILGKAASAGMRAIVQAAIVLTVVAVIRIPLQWSVVSVAGSLLAVLLGATLLSAFSMVIASLVTSREQFMGLGQLVTLPLLFASNALYSVSIMPGWLQGVAQVNPLTYLVELLRQLLVGVGPDRMLLDVAVLLGGIVVTVAVASRTFPRRVL